MLSGNIEENSVSVIMKSPQLLFSLKIFTRWRQYCIKVYRHVLGKAKNDFLPELLSFYNKFHNIKIYNSIR